MIDFIFIILCLRIVYVAVCKGIVVELFKLLGFLAGAISAFHFYPLWSQALIEKVPLLSKTQADIISFLAALFLCIVAFSLLRKIVEAFIKNKEVSYIEKWASLLVGGVRCVILASVLSFLFYLSSPQPKLFCTSISCRIFKNVVPKMYLLAFKGYKAINPDIEPNSAIEEYSKVVEFF